MIDLPPPQPPQCISETSPGVSEAKIIITVSGDPSGVDVFLAEMAKYPAWKVQADAQSNGVRSVRIEAHADIPYREVGGLIFFAQRRQLSTSLSAVPPICEFKDQ